MGWGGCGPPPKVAGGGSRPSLVASHPPSHSSGQTIFFKKRKINLVLILKFVNLIFNCQSEGIFGRLWSNFVFPSIIMGMLTD
jgi:hypothetical protein